jgi:NADH:ubiquinone oxidoreductase subunit 6 (subunit J)
VSYGVHTKIGGFYALTDSDWWATVPTLTLIGAVGVSLVAVVSTVVVPVAGPVVRDAAAAVTLELGAGAGMAAARLVTVVPTIIICKANAVKPLPRTAHTHNIGRLE